jgi:hypothetical protein
MNLYYNIFLHGFCTGTNKILEQMNLLLGPRFTNSADFAKIRRALRGPTL